MLVTVAVLALGWKVGPMGEYVSLGADVAVSTSVWVFCGQETERELLGDLSSLVENVILMGTLK